MMNAEFGGPATRRFYLFGHNPNSVEEATRCLEAGANALEPDVCYDPADRAFYVHEEIPLIPTWAAKWFRKNLRLEDYLKGIGGYLAESNSGSHLALIAFDLKPPYVYDINALEAVVQASFSASFPDVSVLTTISDPKQMNFLARVSPRFPRRAVGVDEYSSADEVDNFFRNRPLPYTYANGTSAPLLPTTHYLPDVQQAISLRQSGAGPGFRLVYAWTVTSESSMTAFLDADVDGLITDKIERLRDLLAQKYAGRYQLATAQDNPFGHTAGRATP
jgi:hypothetical protein